MEAGLLADAAGRISVDGGGVLLLGQEGDPCCCEPGGGWVRAVACSEATSPRVILAPVRADGTVTGDGGLCVGASGCPVAGGMLVVYAGRCYVIEPGERALEGACVLPGHTMAARVYSERPEGVEVGLFQCLGPEADCDDLRCSPGPPLGCCIEGLSYDCAGRQRRCEGGKDVTYTLDKVTETWERAPGFLWYQRRTEHTVMRGRCLSGVEVITNDPESWFEFFQQRTGSPDSTTRTQPYLHQLSYFRRPGSTPRAADGQPGPACVEDIVEGLYRAVGREVRGCRAGSWDWDAWDETGPRARERWTWRWDVQTPCDRTGGRPAPLPPGIDPQTLKPWGAWCPGCGQ